MREIKRLNLSFDLDREKDRHAYHILKNKNQKTAYVIQAILAFEKAEEKDDNLRKVKQALREVLQEINFTTEGVDNTTQDNQIPEEVFQIFDSI